MHFAFLTTTLFNAFVRVLKLDGNIETPLKTVLPLEHACANESSSSRLLVLDHSLVLLHAANAMLTIVSITSRNS